MIIIDEQLIKNSKEIFLAGGCFWGTEHYFKQIEGVVETEVGFANGHTADPSYKEVYTDTTGYAETVHVKYNPDLVSLEFLLRMFFKAIDPTSLNKQGSLLLAHWHCWVTTAIHTQFPSVMSMPMASYISTAH